MQPERGAPAGRRGVLLALCGGLLALALACAVPALAMRAGALAPPTGELVLGPYALELTIENRICLQRMVQRPCVPPVYVLRVRAEAGRSTRYYRLLGLPISERYAFYP